ncbi:hypothetical protein ACLRDC_00325 [Gluconacetobacter sacchari]|uniref:Toxin-antitoxin system HicB family antitoxin n=2 Tax=Gluconacetobacter sacchari TaxID=92759 RepID=A0A7W4NNY3_9PROT|nr:toxin-antitoxin system HicB family antitoxin [Gluconacetobacter sacchari]MBB2161321.1 toxin-antitoxin system HicB family antitoxin [Gluconacetobacter sacchari]GBQ30596.1 hypothetical protein AA12717_3531 [Gluconacetobacter sacchari DSM 12717]
MTAEGRRGRPRGPDKAAFALRLDPALLAAIRRSADADLRSVNAQIEILLREALARRGRRLAESPPESDP